VLVLRPFDLQPNIPERNPIVKRDPTVFCDSYAWYINTPCGQ